MKHYKFILSRLIRYFLAPLILLPMVSCKAQLDLERFRDSAHHWYDINDQDKVIIPLKDKPKYSPDEIEKIADNILFFQKVNGGWAKNFDMQAILTEEQIEKVISDKQNLNTTYDNGATHSQLTYLAEAYTQTEKTEYSDAFFKGLDFVIKSQYDNGGWPQFFPDTSGYRKYITFNDGAMMGVVKLLSNIVNFDPNYKFVTTEWREKANNAYQKAVDCILKCQIVENGKMTAWCQQHDNITLKPKGARTFEPAAIGNGESAEIVMFLMNIKDPDKKVINSIKNAVSWFEESAIHGIRMDIVEAPRMEFKYHTSTWDRVVVEDENAPRIWTRFYELGTYVPLFCRRDGRKVYKLSDVERERRSGYSWYNYEPETVLTEYPNWLKRNNL